MNLSNLINHKGNTLNKPVQWAYSRTWINSYNSQVWGFSVRGSGFAVGFQNWGFSKISKILAYLLKNVIFNVIIIFIDGSHTHLMGRRQIIYRNTYFAPIIIHQVTFNKSARTFWNLSFKTPNPEPLNLRVGIESWNKPSASV